MSDEENQREVDALLGTIVRQVREFTPRYEAFMRACDAFLAAVEDDPYSPNLRTLREAVTKTHADASRWSSSEYVGELRGVLARWNRPGRQYVDFVRKARDAVEYYNNAARETYDESRKVIEQIQRIDAAGRRP
jgi:hypothetical protein